MVNSQDYIEAWFDGCCEPINPGGNAAYGALVHVNGKVKLSVGEFVCSGPEASNNVAEYSGILRVLQWLDENISEPVKVTIRGDSKLVINQLSGQWNTNCGGCGKPLKRCICHEPKPGLYYPFFIQAKTLYDNLNKRCKLSLKWIPRDQNSLCDVLSKGVLKSRGVEFRIQPEGDE